MLSVGSRIKQLRAELGLTQEDLANNLNKKCDLKLNKGMISKWESDNTMPSLEHARYLAEYFNVSLDYLIGVTGDKGSWKNKSKENLLTEEDVIMMAAHKVGHEGALSEDDFEKIKLAIKIALMKNNK